MADMIGHSAAGIAAAVRAGEVTAGEVVAGHLDRIARLNAELGAFVRIRTAEAATEALAVDARADRGELPLAGVPVAVEDYVPVTGEPMTRGSAAAVASALVPLAHGTDALGSVRIPAAACGLFGIKPGSDVLPGEPGEHDWYGMSESGALATTVADAALMLGVMAGAAYSPAGPGRLRIAASRLPARARPRAATANGPGCAASRCPWRSRP